jgi:hypothetical protein
MKKREENKISNKNSEILDYLDSDDFLDKIKNANSKTKKQIKEYINDLKNNKNNK